MSIFSPPGFQTYPADAMVVGDPWLLRCVR
jgi:hypothetical protein